MNIKKKSFASVIFDNWALVAFGLYGISPMARKSVECIGDLIGSYIAR